MMSGITSTGFVPMTFTELKAAIESALKQGLDENLDLSPQSFFGQITGIESERLAVLWDLAQATFNAMDPDQATGAALENICAITGTIRLAATRSTVAGVAVGTNTTALLAGRVVSASGVRFETLADATIVTLSAWAISHAYAVGNLVTADSGKVYSCTVAGTSAGSGGPTGTGTAITDGGVTWRYCGAGTAAVAVSLQAQDTGPKLAAAGTLTVIETPVGGWSSFVNPLDATAGRDVETDSALRLRRELELRATGTSPAESIRANLLEVNGVTSCTVFENVTDATDVNGLPPHSIECLVLGGTGADVAACIWANKAAGIATFGSSSRTVTDSQGTTHTINYTRPTPVTIWVTLTLTKDPAAYPADGDTQVRAAVVAFGNLSTTGKDAVSSAFGAQAFKVDGVLDVSSVLVGITNPPVSSATMAVTVRQIAQYDTSRIVVNSSDGVP